MIRIRRNLNLALAGLAFSAVLAGAERAIVIEEADEIYKATFDDTKAPEARMREWILLSPYVATLNSDENFDMAISVSRENGVEKIDKVFFAIPIDRCRNPGCGSRPVDSAWLGNARKNLEVDKKQVQRLETMMLPAVLEPVRSYLLAHLRFTLDLERARFRYVKDGNAQPLRTLFAATCRSSKSEDPSMFVNLAGVPQSARPAASNKWYNRLIGCGTGSGNYPLASWQAFVREYGIRETRISRDPDSE